MTEELDITRTPQHTAITMDGSGRWAIGRNKPRSYGHQAGVDTVRRIASECARLDVEFLTLYTFSTENWNRPTDETAALMGLVLTSLGDEILVKNNARFRVIDGTARLPEEMQKKLCEAEEYTAKNSAMTMVVVLDYSVRWEIAKAVREVVVEHQANSSEPLRPETITEEVISEHLETNPMPDSDLLIRTGGELRISDYPLQQIAHSELYFYDTRWPDFDEQDLQKAIVSFQSRQRRFGKTEKQVEENENNQVT